MENSIQAIQPPQHPFWYCRERMFVSASNLISNESAELLQNIAHIQEQSLLIRGFGPHILCNIEEILNQMFEEFCENYPKKSQTFERFRLSKSLYYYLLEKIIYFEFSNRSVMEIKNILMNEYFNKALIACCIELVLAAYNPEPAFPWILNCFKISSFYLYKIIETIIKRQCGILTRSLAKHLICVEEICLDSLSWQKFSPIWEIIQDVSGPLPTFTEVNFNNKIKKAKLLERKAGPLIYFLRKFYQLSWMRIKDLCYRLKINEEMMHNKIWFLFEHMITQHFDLMKDRHVDQMILCTVYLFITICEFRGITFATIISAHKQQPLAKSEIYTDVLIKTILSSNGKLMPVYSNIIHFYNNVYMPRIATFMMIYKDQIKSYQMIVSTPPPPADITRGIGFQFATDPFIFVELMEPKSKVSGAMEGNSLIIDIPVEGPTQLKRINEIVRSHQNGAGPAE